MSDGSAKPEGVRHLARWAVRRLWYSFFRYHPYYYMGALQWATMGGEESERFQRVFELVRKAPLSLRAYSLRFYLDELYYGRYAHSTTLPEPNRLRWSGPLGVAYHQEMLENYMRHPEEFEREYGPLLARVQEALREAPFEYVVEIGCGNGLLIERVAALAPEASATFVGLDISPETLALTRERCAGSRVEYHCCNTLQEFLERGRPASVLVVANGTATFFTSSEFVNLLTWLRSNVPRGAVVVRDITHLEAEREQRSRPAGGYVFHHNYGFLLAQAGLNDIRCQYEPVPDIPLQAVVASASWEHARQAKPSSP